MGGWFLNVSEIEPGGSAVLGGNLALFYIIHSVALTLISLSLLSCIGVILSITLLNRSTERWDFSTRFPLYLAITDGLWGLSHLLDHSCLITYHAYPSNSYVSGVLGVNLWFFLGYQQLMHAGLALFVYLKVVRRFKLDLGEWEWKLHLTCGMLQGLTVVIFYPLDAFGCTGYWILQNLKTASGGYLGLYAASSTAIQATCTLFGYRSIRKIVSRQTSTLKTHEVCNESDGKPPSVPKNANSNSPITNRKEGKESYHSTATQCLTTFVLISATLYAPLAFAYFAFSIETVAFGVIEPTTVIVILVVANCSGLANGLGYYYNNRLKAARRRGKEAKGQVVTLSETNSTN